MKRGRKSKDAKKIKPPTMIFLKDCFKDGYQTDGRKVVKPQDVLTPYRCIVNDRRMITLYNNTYTYNDEVCVVPTIWFTNVYYEPKHKLADPQNDTGRREIHTKFNLRDYPFIMTAMKEMKSRNQELFKNIPEFVSDLETTGYETESDVSDHDESYESPDE